MDPFDQETERYLREFQPRAIQPLKVGPTDKNIFSRRLAVVALLVLLAGGLLWFAHREMARSKEAANFRPAKEKVTREQRYPSALALTRLALEDNEKLDSVLAKQSREVLPTVQGKQSMLRVLAKD
jgi:hypothetical protein